MKTQKILFSCLVMLTFALSSSFASKNETAASARTTLIKNVDYIVQKIPFEEFIGNVKECKMTIVFKVNENSEVTDYVIDSDNESLNHITELHLNRAHLKADPILKGYTYRIKVNFVNLAY